MSGWPQWRGIRFFRSQWKKIAKDGSFPNITAYLFHQNILSIFFTSYKAVTPDEHQTRTRRQTAPVPVTAQPAAARHEGNQSGGTGAQACPEHDAVCDYMSLSLSITSHLFYHLHVSYMIVCQELTFPTPHLPVAWRYSLFFISYIE